MEQIRVLHVDDEPEFTTVAAQFLLDERAAFDIVSVHDATAALDRLDAGDVDCVVAEYDVPDSEGLTLLNAVRDRYPALPFILFTGKGSEALASEAIAAGVTDYLPKAVAPSRFATLADRIETAVSRYRADPTPERRLRYQETLAEVGRLALSGADEPTLYGTTTRLVAETLDVPFVGVFERQTTGGLLLRAGYGFPADAVGSLTIDIDPETLPGRVLSNGAPAVRADGAAVPDAFESLGIRAQLASPLGDGDEAWGVLCCCAPTAVEMSREARSLLQQTASLLTAAVDRAPPVAPRDEQNTAFADITARALDLSPVGTILLDADFRVVWANTAVATFFGLDREALVGQAKHPLIESTIKDVFADPDTFRDRVLATYENNTYIEEFECHVLPDENREERWLQHWSHPIEQGPFAGGRLEHYLDMTDRKRLEDELREDVAALRELHSAATVRDLPFEERVTRVLELGRDLLGLDVGALTHVHEGTQDILAAASEGESMDSIAADARRLTLERGELTSVLDADSELLEDSGLACYIGAPVTVDGERYGTICFSGTAPREEPFTPFERTYVGLLAEWLGYELGQRRAKAKLERQNERLEEFASLVSHDLRSPLAVAQGYLSLAQEVGDERHFERVANALDRMNTIIEDVLALARLGGDIENPVAIDLAQLAEEAWDGVDTEGATLRTEAGAIDGDERRLLRLFENLFRNSVEHAGETVTVRVGPLDGGGFFVEDDGPGIPEDARAKVFDGGYTTSENGTGFGLSIVNEIAAGHGWTVTITDAAGGGARFEFRVTEPPLVYE